MPQMEKNTVKDTVKELLFHSAMNTGFPLSLKKPPKTLQSAAAYKVMFFLYFTLDQYNSDLLACFLIYNSIDFDDGNATYNSNQYTNHMQCNYMFSRMNNTVTYLQ